MHMTLTVLAIMELAPSASGGGPPPTANLIELESGAGTIELESGAGSIQLET